MSRHEGVSCDSCLKGNFRGRRYKCLICYDYDLCATCYEAGATTTRHTTEHPMQCILTRSDFDLYYGGEALTVEQPQAFTCPYCGKMGFTETTLQEHVTSEHSETTFEVVCPVCASLPGGDPNLVTDDFAGHLTLEHRSGPRDLWGLMAKEKLTCCSKHHRWRRELTSSYQEYKEDFSAPPMMLQLQAKRLGDMRSPVVHSLTARNLLLNKTPAMKAKDEPAGSRHGVRRIPHPSRGVGGPRARRSNMHFSSSGGLSSLSPSSRESVDPIAELLSQLSGVRRSATGQGSTPSQLQQLQMQLQLERQQVRAARQQLERLPRRQTQTASSANSSAAGTSSSTVAAAVGGHTTVTLDASSSQTAQNNSLFLLSRCMDSTLSDSELQSIEQERADRSLFVQELVLATLTEGAASLVLESLPQQDCASSVGSRKEREERASVEGTGTSPRAPSAPQKAASMTVPKRSSRNSNNSAATSLSRQQPGASSSTSSSSLPSNQQQAAPLQQQQQQQQQLQQQQHHDLRGAMRGLQQQQQQPVRVLTGTGTIREVVPSVGGGYVGRGGSVRGGAGAGSPGPTRRKPVRPVEGRNQSTEPPPPH